MQMRLFLGTTNTKLSPQIELQRCSVYAVSNRVNSEVANYATDPRVNTIQDDPSACQYLSKEITLEILQLPLRLLLMHIFQQSADIRAFYAIASEPGLDSIFTPFPGYLNLDTRGLVIDEADNDGRSDTLVPTSSRRGFSVAETDFIEHVFSVDNLPSFRSYRIKIVMTSTNQVLVPQMRNLRVIALSIIWKFTPKKVIRISQEILRLTI